MLPRVIVHNAVSVDGRIDWFTADVGLFYELAGRWNEDATLAGSDTILRADWGTLDESEAAVEPPAPDPADRRPLLVVPDSRGRIGIWQQLRQTPYWRGVIALCSRSTPAAYIEELRTQRVETIIAGEDRVDLRAALAELRTRHGVATVRVDSGGTLNGVLLRAGLVDEVSLLVHPSLVGGLTPRSIFRAPDLDSAAGVIDLRLDHLERLRDDIVWLRYSVSRPAVD